MRDVAAPAGEPRTVATTPLVFVVDDDPSVRKSVARLLRVGGYCVEIFASAEDFLDRLRAAPPPGHAYRPSCVVLDVHLPGITGLDVQRAIGGSADPVPVVFITGRGDVRTSVDAMKAGAVDFLSKPFGADELLDAVDRAMKKAAGELQQRGRLREIARRYERLTPREREVLAALVTGKLNKQIAAELGAVEKTVKVHRARIMRKMQARSFAELVRMALHLGIAPAGRRASDLLPDA